MAAAGAARTRRRSVRSGAARRLGLAARPYGHRRLSLVRRLGPRHHDRAPRATPRYGSRRRRGERAAELRAIREPGHGPESLSRCGRNTSIQHRRCQPVVLHRGARVSARPCRSRLCRGDLSHAAGDSRLARARHALRHRHGSGRCAAAGRRERSATHLDGRQGWRLGGDAAHRQAGGDQRALVQRGHHPARPGGRARPRRRSGGVRGARRADSRELRAGLLVRGGRLPLRRHRWPRRRGGRGWSPARRAAATESAVRAVPAACASERRESPTRARDLCHGALDAGRLALPRRERPGLCRALPRRPARARRRLPSRHGLDLAARPVRERSLSRTCQRPRRARVPACHTRALARGLRRPSERDHGRGPALRAPRLLCAGLERRRDPAGVERYQYERTTTAQQEEPMNTERKRLAECTATQPAWKTWGPYLSERQWGTVREDYSPHGNAWEYFPHDHARSRAYRWGEDGIAGFSDHNQTLCLSLALWNGRDPILKERLFGLSNGEGNHGEDVKELYYYLDATPTHSYLKMLYKYPQAEYPYARLVEENRQRGSGQPELELIDTGVFDDNRYFDVFVEYAQEQPGDVLLRVTVENRGPEPATLHLLPQLWFRNTWSWKTDSTRPIRAVSSRTASTNGSCRAILARSIRPAPAPRRPSGTPRKCLRASAARS